MLAIKEINDLNCVKIVQKEDNDRDYVNIQIGDFMSSYVGRQVGKQIMTMKKSLMNHGSVMHELYHALGIITLTIYY